MKKSGKIENGGMGEWLKPAVLKTVSGVTRSGVRIPLPPPARFEISFGVGSEINANLAIDGR